MTEPSAALKETYKISKQHCKQAISYLDVIAVAVSNEQALRHIRNAQKELTKAFEILENNGFEIEEPK